MRPPLPILFDPDAVETDAFAAADSNFWHDVRDTGTLIWDTKSFIDVVPKRWFLCYNSSYKSISAKNFVYNRYYSLLSSDLPSEIALGSSKELTGTVGTVFTKFTIYNEINHMNSIIL